MHHRNVHACPHLESPCKPALRRTTHMPLVMCLRTCAPTYFAHELPLYHTQYELSLFMPGSPIMHPDPP